ncbi:MAG: hypothetical protein AABX03_02540 [Nanoarchaeota archaeon]
MGFFSKNKKSFSNDSQESMGLPELPSLSDMPQFSQSSDSMNRKPSMLPSLPNSKSADEFNKTAIKETVSNYDDYNIPESEKYPPIIQKPRAIEYDPYSRQNPQNVNEDNMIPSQFPIQSKQNTFEMSEYPKMKKGFQPQMPPQSQQNFSKLKRKEPLFVKLDKIENTISALNEIKLRISELDSLLRNIKEIKMKEEQELREWERELETIKTRLDQVDKDLFKDIGE